MHVRIIAARIPAPRASGGARIRAPRRSRPGDDDPSAIIALPCGALAIHTRHDGLTCLRYLPMSTPEVAPRDALAARAVEQIAHYLRDPDYRFDLPLAPAGTDFQRRVWRGIAAVPRGAVTTYGALAREVGSAARAVGQACGDNPYPLVVPCHRVVAASGLGGFAHGQPDGHEIGIKRWLLRHEGALP